MSLEELKLTIDPVFDVDGKRELKIQEFKSIPEVKIRSIARESDFAYKLDYFFKQHGFKTMLTGSCDGNRDINLYGKINDDSGTRSTREVIDSE